MLCFKWTKIWRLIYVIGISLNSEINYLCFEANTYPIQYKMDRIYYQTNEMQRNITKQNWYFLIHQYVDNAKFTRIGYVAVNLSLNLLSYKIHTSATATNNPNHPKNKATSQFTLPTISVVSLSMMRLKLAYIQLIIQIRITTPTMKYIATHLVHGKMTVGYHKHVTN